MSSVQTKFTVKVEVPKPREIQLQPLIDPGSLPSCIPQTTQLKNTRKREHNPDELANWNWKTAERDSEVKPLVAVFMNTSFSLEVSVATGSDLLFRINIWNGEDWETFEPVPHQGGTRCNTPLACRSVVQVRDAFIVQFCTTCVCARLCLCVCV